VKIARRGRQAAVRPAAQHRQVARREALAGGLVAAADALEQECGRFLGLHARLIARGRSAGRCNNTVTELGLY